MDIAYFKSCQVQHPGHFPVALRSLFPDDGGFWQGFVPPGRVGHFQCSVKPGRKFKCQRCFYVILKAFAGFYRVALTPVHQVRSVEPKVPEPVYIKGKGFIYLDHPFFTGCSQQPGFHVILQQQPQGLVYPVGANLQDDSGILGKKGGSLVGSGNFFQHMFP